MPNAQEFYRAAIPEPWQVLGLRLRPFSAGHLILLHRFDIALVTGEPVLPGDIVATVFFCSRTYEQSMDALDADELGTILAGWGRQLLAPSWLQRVGLRKPCEIDWAEKARMLGDYIQQGSTYPHYSYKESDFRRLDLPTVQIVIATLLSKTNLSDTEILNRPYGRCLWDFISIRALDGSLTVTDREPIHEALETAKRVAEKLAARRKNNGET